MLIKHCQCVSASSATHRSPPLLVSTLSQSRCLAGYSARCSRTCCNAVSPKSSSSVAPGSSSTLSTPQQQGMFMRFPGDHSFNLAEYMVVLDKPIGLTLAIDPAVNQIVVQAIKEGSPAAQCGMIQVGDVVKMCSAVFGEDMWQALDIRRVRWAINNRTSKVKLVFERSKRTAPGAATWYSKGQVGCTTHERELLQLPVSFNTIGSQDDGPQDIAAPGRPLMVAFHTPWAHFSQSASQHLGAAAVARTARLQAVREELADARREPEMELGPPSSSSNNDNSNNSSVNNSGNSSGNSSSGGQGSISAGQSSSIGAKLGSGQASSSSSNLGAWPSSSTNGSAGSSSGSSSSASGPLGRLMESLAGGMVAGSSSSNGTGAGSTNNTGSSQAEKSGRRASGGVKDKKVIPVLPWLLVSSGRIDTRDLTQIASHRGLSAVLELGLCRVNGMLAIRGATEASLMPPALPQPLPTSSAFLSTAAAGNSSGAGGLQGPGPGPLSIVSSALTPRPRGGPAGSAGAASPDTGVQPKEQKDQAAASELRVRALINSAAALQRLAVRRQWGTVHHATPDTCNVLLHCGEPGLEADVACMLAAWLHWYTHMPLQEALLSAEIALGCAIQQQGVVEAATEALVAAAEERLNQVVLTWRYGGLSASVAGDVVGSWSTRMPLIRCKNPLGCKGAVARGNFYLELNGLRPGVYNYKYIVDGTWAVDPAAPKVLDASGNWNNVLEVHQRPPVTGSKERLALARWHARHLAWEAKMGLRPPH